MSDADFLLTELAEQEKQFQSARKPTLVLIPALQHAPASTPLVSPAAAPPCQHVSKDLPLRKLKCV